MPTSFILINTSPNLEYEVYNKLQKIREINEIHPLFGEYDIIIKIQTKDYSEIGDIVLNKIKIINGIIDTKTLTGTNFIIN